MTSTGFVSRLLIQCATAAFATLLVACGGGGGNGGPAAPRPAQPTSLSISGLPTAAMMPGQSAQLTATLTYSDSTTKDVTAKAAWSTSDASVLSASAAGAVLAVATGQAEVAVSAEGLNGRAMVSVAPAPPESASLTITGVPVLAMIPGQRAQLTATATYADAPARDVTASARWITSDTDLMTVDASGMVTAHAAGTVDVTATNQGQRALVAVRVSAIDPPVLALLAGNAGGPGNIDGSGAAARFEYPQGLATDSAGNLFVADTYDTVHSGDKPSIRRITPAGDVSTLPIEFPEPRFGVTGLTADAADNLYAASNATILKITPVGIVTTLAGLDGQYGSIDGTGAAARFQRPYGIAIGAAGDLYVADEYTIRSVTPDGLVRTLAGSARQWGSADGQGAAARFGFCTPPFPPQGGFDCLSPTGVAADGAGNVFVADTGNHTVRKITPAGVVSTFAGSAGLQGSNDGVGAAARFSFPTGLSVDGTGYVNVIDTGNFTVRSISPEGVVSTLAGAAGKPGSEDGPGTDARFGSDRVFPLGRSDGLARDRAGNLYVADPQNFTVRKISPLAAVNTLAGAPRITGSADGIGSEARLTPWQIAVDRIGNVYVADVWNHAVRKIAPSGAVTTLAGVAGQAGSADGIGPEARFNTPSGVAIDSAGNVFVADSGNHTIRKISPAGAVSTFAGTAGQYGYVDDIGPAARFGSCSFYAGRASCSGVTYLCIDRADNVYITDQGNGAVRRITPAGVVTTLARPIDPLGGITTDRAGNVYVVTGYGGAITKITPQGVVSLLAGAVGEYGSNDGVGTVARFNALRGLAIDSADNIYVADRGNDTVRKITPTGFVSTVVGTAGKRGFVAGTLPGVLAYPGGVAVLGSSLYITFDQNGVVMVTNVP